MSTSFFVPKRKKMRYYARPMTASAAQTPESAPKRGRGQPTKYQPEFVERAHNLALLGLTIEEFATAFGVGHGTITRWQLAHPEFRDAIKSGGVEADGVIARRVFNRAEHDTTAGIFWLKNRQPRKWRDKHEIDHTVDFAGKPREERQTQLWTMAERAGLVIDHEPSGFDGVPEEECEDE